METKLIVNKVVEEVKKKEEKIYVMSPVAPNLTENQRNFFQNQIKNLVNDSPQLRNVQNAQDVIRREIQDEENKLNHLSKQISNYNGFTLMFKSKILENDFLTHFYGEKRCLRFFISTMLGAFMYGQFALTEIHLEWYWWGTDIGIAIWLFALSFVFLVPWFIQKRLLCEFVVSLTIVLITFRTMIRDLSVEGIYPPFSPIKSGVFTFEIGCNMLLRPRIIWVIPCTLFNSIFFLIYSSIYAFIRPQYDGRVAISLLSCWFNEVVIFMFVYFLNMSSRENFLRGYELKIKMRRSQLENKKTKVLLSNIIPLNFLPAIESGQLDSHNNCLVEKIENGALLKCDIASFSEWSSSVSTEKVTKVLNHHFDYFDTMIENLKYVEKVKTAGDSFIACAKDERGFSDIVLFGVGIAQSIKIVNKILSLDLKMRVGVDSGKFYSVVHGSFSSRINFDVYGNLFYVTQHLERSCPEMTIHVGKNIYTYTKQDFEYTISNLNVFDGSFSHRKSFKKFLRENELQYLIKFDVIGNCFERIKSMQLRKKLEKIIGKCTNEFFPNEKKILADYFSNGINFDNNSMIGVFEVNRSSSNSPQKLDGLSRYVVSTTAESYSRYDDGSSSFMRKMKKLYEMGMVKLKKRIINEDGFIFPLLMFNNIQMEVECYEDLFRKSWARNTTFFLFPLIFQVLILTRLVVTFKFDELWINYYIITVYICVIIHFLSFVFLFFFQRLRHIYVYYGIVFINFLAYKVSFFCCLFHFSESNSTVDILSSFYAYYMLMDVTLLAWESMVHHVIKLFVSGINIILLVVKNILLPHDIGTFVDVQLFAVMFISFFVSQYVREINTKLSFMIRRKIRQRSREIRKEKEKNEALVFSAMPPQIVSQIKDDNFKSFSSSRKYSFVCFMKLSNFVKHTNDNNIRSMLTFLSNLFECFDKHIQDHGLITVKKIQESYLFISHEVEIERTVGNVLRNVLKALYLCQLTFVEKLTGFKGSLNDEILHNMALLIGLNFGSFSSGVLGKKTFLFDVFGDCVNISALCCNSSENCQVTVPRKKFIRIIENCNGNEYDIFLELRNTKETIFVEGRGDIKCSTLSYSIDGKEVTVIEKEREVEEYEDPIGDEEIEFEESVVFQSIKKSLSLERLKKKSEEVQMKKEKKDIKDITIKSDRIVFVKAIGRGVTSILRSGYMKLGVGKIPVAIKEIALGDSITKDFVIREVQICSSLHHNNLMETYGCYFDKGSGFIVMELCKTSLYHLIHSKVKRTQKISSLMLLNFLYEISKGIEHLHSKNIIHRDLKSLNVLLSNENPPRCKVCDFGNAVHSDTLNYTLCGTVEYLAPEIIDTKNEGRYTHKVDVYSFGIMIWEIWTRKIPFAKEKAKAQNNQMTLLKMIQEGNLLPSPSEMKDAPYGLKMLYIRCTQKSPDDRLESFSLISGILKGLLQEEVEKRKFDGSLD